MPGLTDIGDLKAAPYNPRRISEPAATALRHSVFEFGDISGIVWNSRTGHLVCGHQRLDALRVQYGDKLALEDGAIRTPSGDVFAVRVVDWPEAKEKAANVAANSALLAGDWTDGLADVLADVQADIGDLFENLRLDEIELPEAPSAPDTSAEDEGGEDDDEGMADDGEPITVQERYWYKAINDWDLPELLPHRLATKIPTATWVKGCEIKDPDATLYIHGTNKLPDVAHRGVLGFYADDVRFQTVWSAPVAFADKLESEGWETLISPDFSLWRNWPLACQIFNLYRSYWVARYWQERGFNVIPSLNWSDERTHAWAFQAIPQGCPVVSLQCRTTRSPRGREYFAKGVRAAVEAVQPENVVLYGGPQHEEWLRPILPEGPTYHLLASWSEQRNLARGWKEASNG